MADQLRVMVLDEDPNSRVETRKALQRAELEVAGETGFGTGAVSLALDARPDAVLISVEEPAASPSKNLPRGRLRQRRHLRTPCPTRRSSSTRPRAARRPCGGAWSSAHATT